MGFNDVGGMSSRGRKNLAGGERNDAIRPVASEILGVESKNVRKTVSHHCRH